MRSSLRMPGEVADQEAHRLVRGDRLVTDTEMRGCLIWMN
jgi:hypothetical protein